MTFHHGCFDWHLYVPSKVARLLFVLLLSLQSPLRAALVSGLLILFVLFLLPP